MEIKEDRKFTIILSDKERIDLINSLPPFIDNHILKDFKKFLESMNI